MLRRNFGFALAILALFASITTAADLKKGDRIVFLGDSITAAGARPGGYVTQVREAIDMAKSDLGIEVIGAGISGNKVPDLQRRLQRDVISKKPTVVVIYIGINDVWHSVRGRGTDKDAFEAGLKDVIGKCNAAGARVILCTPTVIGEKTDGTNKLDKMLDEYSAISRKVATETKSQMIDLRKLFIDELKSVNEKNADKGVLTGDTVHLNAAGNKFVAAAMLEGLGVSSNSGKLLRHVVVFKFNDDVTKEKIAEVEKAFAALPSKIDSIVDFEWGLNNSPEGLAQDHTHVFLVTFKNEAGRDKYLPHPAHLEFVKLVKPLLGSVFVVDYWADK